MDDPLIKALMGKQAKADPWAWRSDMNAQQPQFGHVPEARSYEPAAHDKFVNALTNALYGDNANARQREGVNHLAGPDNPFNIPAQVNQGYNTLAQGVALRDPAQAGIGVAQMAMSLPFGIGKAPAQAATKGIRAYHGSPHDFDKFSLDKIGTGEGAQAYGHGLYFAENEGVAKNYRDALGGGGRMLRINGKEIGSSPSEITLHNIYNKANGNIDAAIANAELYASYSPDAAAAAVLLKKAKAGEIRIEDGYPGRMYEVNIKADPNDFLDWDKPLSQQSEQVKWQLGSDPNKPDVTTGDAFKAMERDIRRTNDLPEKDGREMLTRELKKKGIPGIKYLDQGSRTAGEGSRNYVVFDDSLIEILRKYGLAGLMAGGAAATASTPADAGQ